MKRPADHPRRVELDDEAHARPPETPLRLAYLALLWDDGLRARERAYLAGLAANLGVAPLRARSPPAH